jgi:hypothetical protein
MTLETMQTVKLSFRDWVAIGTLVFAVMASLVAAFMHHDRLLVQLVTQQETANHRLDKIESKIERTH